MAADRTAPLPAPGCAQALRPSRAPPSSRHPVHAHVRLGVVGKVVPRDARRREVGAEHFGFAPELPRERRERNDGRRLQRSGVGVHLRRVDRLAPQVEKREEPRGLAFGVADLADLRPHALKHAVADVVVSPREERQRGHVEAGRARERVEHATREGHCGTRASG